MTTYRVEPYKQFQQGEVVLVRFPFTNYSALKKRPAVVVSAGWFNQSRLDCLLAAITSQLPNELEREDVRVAGSDLQVAGLPRDSIVKSGKVMALQRTMIEKSIGRLPDKTLQAVLEKVSDVLGLI